MEAIMAFNNWLNAIVWGPLILVLIVGTGLYLTIGTGGVAWSKLGYILRNTVGKMLSKVTKGEGEVTPYQALATAISATVGVGNIAGVATAIALGGPGAIFWMWVSGVVGMTSKFAEAVLAVRYREQTADGRFVGGPMYYLAKGLGLKWLGRILAVLFSIFGALAAFGIGNMVQANSVAMAFDAAFGVPPIVTGILLTIAVGATIIGGLKRLVKVTQLLIPIMVVFYFIGTLIVILINAAHIPGVFGMIFSQAFTGTAAVGGFAGATVMMAIRFGIARGVFSNEAGMGSAPIVHAAAKTDHPVRQGLWGVFEVFLDTPIVCSLTALMILSTGVWQGGLSGSALAIEGFSTVFGGFAGPFLAIALLMFAGSTILGWSYYGERCAEHLLGPKVNMVYRILWLPPIIIGAVGGLEEVWLMADTLNALMAFPNLVGLLLLSGVVFKLTREFFDKQAKEK
jgi:AGCS family alanine or glycine:cation symporter